MEKVGGGGLQARRPIVRYMVGFGRAQEIRWRLNYGMKYAEVINGSRTHINFCRVIFKGFAVKKLLAGRVESSTVSISHCQNQHTFSKLQMIFTN